MRKQLSKFIYIIQILDLPQFYNSCDRIWHPCHNFSGKSQIYSYKFEEIVGEKRSLHL